MAIGTYLLLSGLFFWVASWLWPPRPACLSLVGAGYETNLAIPHNAFGIQGLRGLKGLAHAPSRAIFWRSKRLRLKHEPRTLGARGGWDKDLGSFPERTLVLAIAAHGGSDAEGAYLLAADADADPGRGNRIRLGAVLDRLEGLPAGKNKILILDATQVVAHWPTGLLHNNFARELEALDARIARIPNLVVLSASGPDQRSWTSEDWGQTAFGHYLVEGLNGADGAANAAGRVDVLGLHRFIKGRVERWARANRGAVQTPVLLPKGPLGEARAAAIEVASAGTRTLPEFEKIPIFVAPTELVKAWESSARLRDQEPSPSSYSPQTWARYQATLVRLEELLRAGDRTSEKILLSTLADLGREIAESRTVALASSRNTLAMPAAEGTAVPASTDAVLGLFDDLWDAPAEGLAGRWARLRAVPWAGSPSDLRRLRAQLLDLTLLRVAGDPAGRLGRGGDLIRALDDPGAPRPAEGHDLVMLRRPGDAPPEPTRRYFEAVGKALLTRRLAERAAMSVRGPWAPSSERVHPWTRERMLAADGERRLGQDLLFAADEARWGEAIEHLDAADRLYRETLEEAGVVQEALALRDEVFPILPDLASWAARRGVPDADLLALVEATWADAHALDRVLGMPAFATIRRAPAPTDDDPAPIALADRIPPLRRRFDDIRRRYARACEEALRGDGAEARVAIDAVLRVPILDLPSPITREFPGLVGLDRPLRLALIAEASRTGRRLLLDSLRPTSTPPAIRPAVKADDAGRIEARMALATLGRRRFEEGRDPDSDDFERTRRRAEDFEVKVPRGAIALVGAQVGRLWSGLPSEIARTLDRLKTGRRPGDVPNGLRKVERLARQLDGAGAQRLALHALPPHAERAEAPPLTRDQLEAPRKLALRELLMDQARRALDDHWYAESADAEPYYRAAGLAYLDDARRLDPLKLLPTGPLASLEAALRRPDGLRLEGPATRVVTSERQIDVPYRVRPEAEGASRPGIPVFWQEPAAGLRAVWPPGGGRLIVRLGAGDPTIQCRLENDLMPEGGGNAPRGDGSTLSMRGLFRGQRLEAPTRIDLHPRAEVIARRHPAPERAGLAVRADEAVFRRLGEGNGAVAFVLDCSGSMGAPKGQPFTKGTNYAVATRAVRQVLSELPAGITVSVYIFGARANKPGGDEVEPEAAIKTVRHPMRWNPRDPDQLASLMAEVSYPASEPWNKSPIVRTIMEARKDLMGLDDVGSKTILVLAEGADNRFAQDKSLNEGKDLPEFLEEKFKGTGIQLNLIGFRSAGETSALRAQFAPIAKFEVPGRFHAVDDAKGLVETLRVDLNRELSYRVVGEGSRPLPLISAREVAVSQVGANERWFPGDLPPGGYKVQVRGLRPLEKSVALDAGDRLLITLSERDGAVDFERVLFSREFFPFRPTQVDRRGEWRASALQNQLARDGSARAILTLEKEPNGRESTLRQLRPREVWFELTAGDLARPSLTAPAPLPVRWSETQDLAAPSWSLVAPGWPSEAGTAARPTLHAWLSPDREASPARTLARGEDFDVDLPGDAPRPFQVDGEALVLESIKVEDHPVEVNGGTFEVKPCLVVRMAHPKGRPAWARLRGIEAAGSEHRFYTSAGKYTGLFWTKTRGEAFAALRGIDIVPLAAFKASCEAEGHTIDLPFDAPRPDDVLPAALGPGRSVWQGEH